VFFLLASLLITAPSLTPAYQKPLPLFGTTAKPVSLAPVDDGVVGCWGEMAEAGGSQVVCARLGNGRSFDAPVALAPAIPGSSDAVPAIAWNGSELLVAFEEQGLPNRLVIAALDRQLRAIEPPHMLTYLPDGGTAPSIAWNGREWLVAARNHLFRLSPARLIVAASDTDMQIQNAVAAGGSFVLLGAPTTIKGFKTQCLSGISWCVTVPVTTTDWSIRLLPSNTSIPFPGSADLLAGEASAASRPGGLVLAWAESSAGRFALNVAPFVTSSVAGRSVAATTEEFSGDPHLNVAANGDAALLVWEESANIRGLFLTAAGKPDGEPFAIAATASEEHRPVALALGPGEYLVAYEIDDRGTTRLATRYVITGSTPARPRPVR